MAAVHSHIGLKFALDTYLAGVITAAFRLHLFVNAITPDVDTVIGDLVEADNINFPGYAAQDLTPYGAAFDDGDHARSTAATYTFTVSSPGPGLDIYGYFVTDSSDGGLYWCERDPDAPVAIGTVAGSTYKVTPNLSDTNE